MASKHGGARPGAGRKKGKVSAAKRELAEMAKGHAENDGYNALVLGWPEIARLAREMPGTASPTPSQGTLI